MLVFVIQISIKQETNGDQLSILMVPGHEIAGVVVFAGKDVKGFKVGDNAGVGCMVDSCLNCEECH